MYARTVQLLVISSLISGAAITNAADSPFLMDKRTFKKTIKTLAITPSDATSALNMPDATGRMFEAEVARRLDRMGFNLVQVDNYRKIRTRMKQQVNGYTIPGSEELDAEKIAAVREHSFREMLHRHDMDALVLIQILQVGAPFEKNKAKWDGVDQKIDRKMGGIGELWGKEQYSGTTRASSLQISIIDRSDQLLFRDQGGIEVVMHLDGDMLAALPTKQLFQDEKRLKKSIQLALKAL